MNHFFKSLSLFLVAGASAITALAQSEGEKSDDTYILRPNDAVQLAVYEEPDLSVQVKILKTGQASFPLIGSVEIGGLRVAAAAEKIRDLYAKDYLVDPKLTLTVDDYAVDFISVIGQVNKPGQIPIPQSGNIDLGSALATAGGILENADTSNIQLVRANGSTTTLTLAAIQGAAGRTRLQSGDRIIVNESRFVRRFVTVLGRVGKPGAVPFPVDGRLDLVTAVAIAGGVTEMANPKKLTISRRGKVTEVDFREMSQRGGDPIWLQPDDIINVPERIF